MGADLRVAVRSLLRRPGHSLVPVITLTVVVAATTVVFSLVEGVLLRPLPYAGGHRLHRVFHTDLDGPPGRNPVTRDALRIWTGGVKGLERIGGYVSMPGFPGTELDADGAFVFQGFFEVFGTEPLIGRLPTLEEVRSSANLLVLSEDLWTTRYGRDPDVLGRTVHYTWTSGTVVGVLPARFGFPSGETQWWSPVPADFADGRTDVPQISAVARLEAGAAPERVEGELLAALSRLDSGDGAYAGLGVRTVSLRDEVVGDVKTGLMQLFWAVFLVLLIASVNLAVLVVASTSRRRGELAVRAALGASRRSLVGVICLEVLLLCAVGGGAGVFAATWLLDPVVDLLTGSLPGFPRLGNVEMNLTVLGFAVGATTIAAVFSGVVPAMFWSRRPPWEALRGTTGGRVGREARLGQAGLLMVESGLAVVLMVAGGLLLRSVVNSHTVDPGFDDGEVAFLEVAIPADEVSGAEELRQAGRRLEDRLASLPGVVSVGRARVLPTLGGTRRNVVWTPEQDPGDGSWIASVEVSPGYFPAMGISVVAGRTFDDRDGADAEPAAVVSRTFARLFFGEADPVGQTVLFGSTARMEAGRMVPGPGDPMRVVGVVEDVRQEALIRRPEPVLYLSLAQRPTRRQSAVVRATGDPGVLAGALRRGVEEASLPVVVRASGSLGTAARRPLAPLRVRTLLLLTLGGLGALLILVGIYGVVARVVADGTHEIGVRMALGARMSGETLRVMGQTLRPVLAGGVLGVAGAVAASGLVRQDLYGVEPADPLTYGVVLAVLAVTAAATAWLPARRAATVDPARTLNPRRDP